MGKTIISAIIVIGLSTTGILAKGNTHLVQLASKQKTLSHNITEAYRKQDKDSVLSAIKVLNAAQTKLRSQVRDDEITNLLVYMNLCLKDLEKIVKKPYSSNNAQKVAELSGSISEGSRYIAASL